MNPSPAQPLTRAAPVPSVQVTDTVPRFDYLISVEWFSSKSKQQDPGTNPALPRSAFFVRSLAPARAKAHPRTPEELRSVYFHKI